jgi:transposase
VAMGEARTREAGRQVAMVCLDELVPADDRYRRIDELVGDWGFVREAPRAYYAEGVGRPSIDPTVLLKLMLAGALEGIGSMRELLRVTDLRLDLRLFLGYGLGERLPAHQTISEAQTQRFADGEIFERLFLCTVALCKGQGLLEGTHLSVDGFHAEANAALRSLRASLEPVADDCGEGGAEDASAPEHPLAAGAIRGTVAAMAMTGVRRLSTSLGLVEETPPEELVEDAAPDLLRRIPPERREAVIELVHWLVGAGGGALFSLLPERLRSRAGVGPVYGLGIFAVFETLIQPVLDTPHAHRVELGERIAIGADHVLYGLILGERFPPRG